MSAVEQCRQCRMCGEMTESGVSLLDPANRHIAQCIVSKFKYMITSNSRFPRYICNKCAEELQDWMYFLERCKKAQTHFSTVVAAEKLENEGAPIKQDPDGPSQVTACPPEDPLLSASELEIAAKFPELKVASVPIVRLDQTDIEKYQQPDISAEQHEVEQCENNEHSDKNQTYICHLCEKKNMRLTSYKLHLTTTHHFSKEEVSKYIPIFECKYCHRQFKTPSLLNIHEGSHTLHFKCDICNKRFGEKGILKRHKLIHSEPQLQCPHCDMKFRHNSSMKMHIETQHSGGVRKYNCDHCELKLKTKADLISHVKFVHALPTSKISWKCAECGKCFKFKKYLRDHKKNVHRGSKYSCIHCGVKFKQSVHLRCHIERQHSGGVRNYKCDQCDKKFKCRSTLWCHIKCVHAVASEKSWECDVCGKCFKFKEYLNSHKVYAHAEAKYCCPHCGKKFKFKSSLKSHNETQHSGGVCKYKCDHCKKRFKSKRYLRNHIKCVHSIASEKSWKCDVCGKCFKFKEYLKSHKLNVHAEAKFCCDHCGKKFKFKSSLKSHIETQHSGGVCKYKCDHCEKKFKCRKYMLHHIRVNHSKC